MKKTITFLLAFVALACSAQPLKTRVDTLKQIVKEQHYWADAAINYYKKLDSLKNVYYYTMGNTIYSEDKNGIRHWFDPKTKTWKFLNQK